VAEAKRLLAEAGYPDGFGLNSGAGHEPIAEALQQMWKENLGVEVEILALYNINRNNRKNNAMYSNPKYDELISAANTYG